MRAAVDVISWGQERARARPWRGDDTVAELAPLPGALLLSTEFVERCLETLASRGFREVLTAALAPAEQAAFLAVGFAPREHLHLLSHDLDNLPASAETPYTSRRARRSDRADVLEIDGRAFAPFWRFDDASLEEAIHATPSARFRIALAPDDTAVGYAISGRAGRRGYLQRLAVHPERQRHGIGRELTLDALRWMRRRGVERAVVNTQPDNDAALRLYRDLGFRLQPVGLAVLGRRIDS